MTELTRDEIARVCRYATLKSEDGRPIDPDGGRLHRSQAYEDATGEARMLVMIDYGIKGLKKMDFSVAELDRADGKLPKRMEDWPLERLEARAAELGAHISGRKGRSKLVVAIRKAEEALRAPRAPAPLTRTELAEEPRLTPPPADPEPGASTEAKAPDPGADLPADLVEAMKAEVLEAFGEKIGRTLIEGGYASMKAVRAAPDENLLGIKGIGARTLDSIRKAQG
jgi:hypothetical protein